MTTITRKGEEKKKKTQNKWSRSNKRKRRGEKRKKQNFPWEWARPRYQSLSRQSREVIFIRRRCAFSSPAVKKVWLVPSFHSVPWSRQRSQGFHACVIGCQCLISGGVSVWSTEVRYSSQGRVTGLNFTWSMKPWASKHDCSSHGVTLP